MTTILDLIYNDRLIDACVIMVYWLTKVWHSKNAEYLGYA